MLEDERVIIGLGGDPEEEEKGEEANQQQHSRDEGGILSGR